MIDGVTTVTDMLAAVLNICTQELNESAGEGPVTIDREKAETKGDREQDPGSRAYFVYVLLLRWVMPVVARCHVAGGSADFRDSLNAYSEESEQISELMSSSGSSRLLYGTLALGAEASRT
jgi:hypothetical protein